MGRSINQLTMTRALSLLFAAFLTASSIFAQAPENDPKAKSILDKLSAKAKGFSTISASFNYTLENKKANLKVNQKGNAKLKGSKYRFDLEDYIVINDGTTAWTYTKDGNEVQVDNASEMKGGNTIKPSELFTIWENGFKYKYDKEITIAGNKFDVIRLFPKDTKNRNYHTIVLTINRAKMEIQNVEVLGKGGENYTYTVTKFLPNASLTEGDFTFEKSKFPGVEVIDNR
jgi:outer membrane lipoprotein carrier protein